MVATGRQSDPERETATLVNRNLRPKCSANRCRIGRQQRTHPRMEIAIGTALIGLNPKDNTVLARLQMESSIGPRPYGRTCQGAGTTFLQLKGAAAEEPGLCQGVKPSTAGCSPGGAT
jgi:hypothetical protein